MMHRAFVLNGKSWCGGDGETTIADEVTCEVCIGQYTSFLASLPEAPQIHGSSNDQTLKIGTTKIKIGLDKHQWVDIAYYEKSDIYTIRVR